VEPRVGVRRDDEGGVPVPPGGGAALVFLRLDADPLAAALVVTRDGAALQLGVDRVRILGIDPRDEAVASLRDEPVLVEDAVLRPRPRRPAQRVVVLQAA